MADEFRTAMVRAAVALAFDKLGYAKRLREGGVPPQQAETHAEAARDYIMIELVTKTDLQRAVEVLELKMERLETKLEAKLEAKFGALDAKIDKVSLRLLVSLGGMILAGIAGLGALMRLG